MLFACNGACPKDRFLKTPDGQPGLNYLCVGFKKFYHHVDPCMRVMAGLLRQQRAPAEIMAMAAEQDKANRRPPAATTHARAEAGAKHKLLFGKGKTLTGQGERPQRGWHKLGGFIPLSGSFSLPGADTRRHGDRCGQWPALPRRADSQALREQVIE